MFARCQINFPRDNLPTLSGRFENPRELLQARSHDEILPLLRQIEAHAEQGRWVIGMMAYEAAPAFDQAFQTLQPASGMPLTFFAVFDDLQAAAKKSAGDFACSVWSHDTSRAAFAEKIQNIREDIASGSYYQTNFTTRLTADFDGDPESFFHALCAAQPDSYALFIDAGDWQIASVSPELFFAWNPQTGEVTTRPMKGTASLNRSAENLHFSAKDRAENLMIVDLLRNDLSRIADHVHVPELFTVQNLSTVRQMTSTIAGHAREGTGLPDIFSALFPCGSITGAPKIAAVKAIAAYESSPRGAYCGALGVIQPGGEALFSIGIRTVTIIKDRAMCGIGSGITWDSNPTDEYAEGQIKQRFLWRGTANFELLETLRLEDGRLWLVSHHEERLSRSAAYFGFIYDAASVRQKLDGLAEQNPKGLYRVRLLVDRRGNAKTEIYPMAAPGARSKDDYCFTSDVVRVCMAERPIDSDNEFLRHKTTNRGIYDAFAPKDPGIFDTLLYNERDEITEFTRGNVAVGFNGKLVTPPESCGLLPGTLRAELLAKGILSEHVITRGDLRDVNALWFLNSLRGMIPARL